MQSYHVSGCKNCWDVSKSNCVLIDDRIPAMSNGDMIIAPRCKLCGERLIINDSWHSKDKTQCVVLISGLCGSGKSTIGKKLEEITGYIHIDGDAVSKRVNWDIKNAFVENRSGYRVFDELLETIQIVLQLDYSVIATYVFTQEEIERYQVKLDALGVKCYVVILNTDIDICVQRDKQRDCWTAGREFILKWHEEQKELADSCSWTVVDNSYDELNVTIQKILACI